jgi:hypothetical protein
MSLIQAIKLSQAAKQQGFSLKVGNGMVMLTKVTFVNGIGKETELSPYMTYEQACAVLGLQA